jgi:drug/metabolite transporter (DMT)-like permease
MVRMTRGQETLAKGGWGVLAALLIANIALSIGPVFVRMTDVGPVAAAWWRMGLATPVLFALAARRGESLRLERTAWLPLFLCGLFFAADLASWHLGIGGTKLANANLLGNAASFLFPIYGFIIAKSWPSRAQGTAMLLAMLGAILLMGRSYELSRANLIGDLLCLLAGVFYTIYLIIVERIRGSMGTWPLLAWSTLASAVPLLIAANLMGERVMPSDWTPLILMAAGSQIIGQGLLIGVIGRVSPLVIGLALLTQPMISALIGWVHYGEVMTPLDWAGAALIASALLLLRGRESREGGGPSRGD